jgi:MoxR-like ATPase
LTWSQATWKRWIQFTPDLLPSDVTGVSIYNQRIGEFEFRPGPILSQVVLADEINRTSPKTQSALLEAMEERQVTVDGVTHQLPRPFLVLATQNPIEYEGTFPIPEAQLDRFLLRIRVGYPSIEEERKVLERSKRPPILELEQVIDSREIIRLQELIKDVHVDPSVEDYLLRLVHRTRQHPDVYLGASPRGSISLYRSSQALALVRGRTFVLPDDVKELAPVVLSHRLILKPESYGVTVDKVIGEILGHTSVPVEASAYGRR